MDMDTATWVKLGAYLGAGAGIGLGAVGAAIGEGFAASRASLAIGRNPQAAGDILKNMLVGQAVAESSSIFALLVAMVLLFGGFSSGGYLTAVALFSAGLCMGLGAIGAGVGSGFPAGEACLGIARQPAMSGRLTTNMLIGSAVCQTPSIFALVVAFILVFTDFTARPFSPTWAALLGAGLATGMSGIGSGIGGGMVAGASGEGVARQPGSVGSVTTTMLVGQAVAQTPSIFGLLVGFILLFRVFPESDALQAPMALFSAGLCTGFGGIGPGIGNGMAGEGAVRWVARNAAHAADLMRTMLVGQAVSQSTAIYALVVSLVLIFVL